MENKHFFRKTNPLLWVLILQAILVVLAFPQFFVSPNGFMFSGTGDGIKNYFTFQAYLQQPYPFSELKIMQQGYPHGDHIFYADLIPIVAVPLKWFCIYIYDISSYSVAIINTICVFLQFILVIPVYKLLDRFLTTKWLIAVLCIGFSWTHPQVNSILAGHYSLFTPILFLLNILLIIKIFDQYQKDDKVYWKDTVQWGILLFVAAFTHLYYWVILMLANGVFTSLLIASLLFQRKKRLIEILQVFLKLTVFQLIAAILVVLIIVYLDDDYANRTHADLGYGWVMMNAQIEGLYTARDYLSIKFLHSYDGPIGTNLYLGNFSLYALLCLILFRVLPSPHRISFSSLIKPQKTILLVLFVISMVIFFISLGERYLIGEETFVTNYFNIFFYLHKITPKVEHFRVLARFFWLTYWIWCILIAFFVEQYWMKSISNFIKGLIIIVASFAIVDAINTVWWLRQNIGADNAFKEETFDKKYLELSGINYANYQAVLSIPFFNLGTEIRGYHLYANDNVYKLNYAISITKKISLLSIISNRLPLEQTKDRFSLFTTPTCRLLDGLSTKPILVLKFKNEKSQLQGDEPAKTVIEGEEKIIQKYKMKKIAEGQHFIVYEWDIQEQKKQCE